MKKMLLVDDEQSFLQILDMALSKYFETYTAAGVWEAIDILKQNAIAIICSDLYMRDGTGLGSLGLVDTVICPIGFAGCGNCNFTFYMSEASEVMDKK